ncbi:MAG: hypothetical protein IH845_01410, partial [Nanoarchaeota archaeon]|nr:hypothetical protein [Nanoarchaeota archaeon]
PNILESSSDLVILRENWLQVDSSTRFLFSDSRRFYQLKKLLIEHKHVTNTKRTRNSSRLIVGKELNKKQLKFWPKQEILDLFKKNKDKGSVLLAASSGSFGEGIDLPGGEYTLILTILYNVNIVEEFRQEFEVSGKKLGITGRAVGFFGDSTNLYFLLLFLIISINFFKKPIFISLFLIIWLPPRLITTTFFMN